MVRIGIITGSTRDLRVNTQVAEWVKSIADQRTDAEFELVDIKDYNLPRYNESVPAVFTEIIKHLKQNLGQIKLIHWMDLFLS